MQLYFWIMTGGALGTGARFFVSGLVANSFGGAFPWGTLVVNVTGSFAIGFFGTLTGPEGRMFVGATPRQFFMTGICGGYTTFSSFSLQTLSLANDREWLQAGSNAVLSLVSCLGAVWLGHALALNLNNLKG
ncbi:MAG: fluoride efflux transporter CrcB [Verrucomicrobia bacterium]|nr:fluoride efflux transporter CrcB [Verrucomicrobiota bacterium]